MHIIERPRNNNIDILDRLFVVLRSGCNSRCITCDIWKERRGIEISLNDICEWVEEWKQFSLSKVILCGEPLTHSHVWEICRRIKMAGIPIEMLSNGYMVEKYARQIVEHCDVLRISLDGPEKIHNTTRGIATAFKKLQRGIQAIRDIAPQYSIGGRCAVNRMNYRHLRQTVNSARRLMLSYISFSGTDVYNEEAFKRHGRISQAYFDSLVIRGEKELAELEMEIKTVLNDCHSEIERGFVKDTSEELQRNIIDYYRGLDGKSPLPTPRCDAPWTSAVLEYSGMVRPCFPLKSYGSIREYGSLSATINSHSAKHYRHTLDIANNLICHRCVCQTISDIN